MIINTKIHFYTKNFFRSFCVENYFAKYFAKCHNLFFQIFCHAHYDNFLKWCISVLQDESNFLVLHDFTKCFSDNRVNQIVNKCLNCQIILEKSIEKCAEIVFRKGRMIKERLPILEEKMNLFDLNKNEIFKFFGCKQADKINVKQVLNE